MSGRDDELEDEFQARVRSSQERMREARRERDDSFWRYVGLIGTIGWSVVIPLLVGALVGFWIDRAWNTGSRFTLILLLLGLALGLLNGWRAMNRES